MRAPAFCSIVLGLSLLDACKSKDAPPGVTTSAPAPTPSPSAAPVRAPVVAPFIVTLEKPASAEKRMVTLSLVIDSAAGFGGQTTLSVSLPDGVKLVEGKPREVLPSLAPGKTAREFKLSPASKLSSDKPARFVVEGQDPAGAFGARAERVYPDPAKP